MSVTARAATLAVCVGILGTVLVVSNSAEAQNYISCNLDDIPPCTVNPPPPPPHCGVSASSPGTSFHVHTYFLFFNQMWIHHWASGTNSCNRTAEYVDIEVRVVTNQPSTPGPEGINWCMSCSGTSAGTGVGEAHYKEGVPNCFTTKAEGTSSGTQDPAVALRGPNCY